MKWTIGFFDIVIFAAGYVACIYSWQWIKVKINGAAQEYDRLRAQAEKIINAVKR